jgi:hypothetical protein
LVPILKVVGRGQKVVKTSVVRVIVVAISVLFQPEPQALATVRRLAAAMIKKSILITRVLASMDLI